METSDIILFANTLIIWLILLSNLLIILALIKKVNSGSERISDSWLKPGSPAPNFEAPDLQSVPVTLDTYQGKSILLAFVRPSCRTCEMLIPKLAKLSDDINRNGQEFAMVCMASQEVAKEFAKQYSIAFQVIVATRFDNTLIQDYKVGATPFYCLIDEDRKVKEAGYFAPEWDSQKKEWTFSAFIIQAMKANVSTEAS